MTPPVHPGELIREMYEERGMRQAHLAGACRVSAKHMNQVISGTASLSATLAVEIEFALATRCAHVLMRMQADYDVHLARLAQAERSAALAKFIAASEQP
jgi:HTH-type transcriptional regulator / antitoxin HigA